VIRSMTGFGAAAVETKVLRASVTVRSLNHRFLDVTLHLPRRLQSVESELRELVGRSLARGRIEIVVQLVAYAGAAESVVAAHGLVASLVKALREIQTEFGLEGGVSVSDVMRYPGVLDRLDETVPLPDEVRHGVVELLGRALGDLEAMRCDEGRRICADLERALVALSEAGARIERRSSETREARRAALVERLRGLVAELGLDDSRLYQEAARAVDRHDVAEEIQRLRSHLATIETLLRDGEVPCGKRLDFLAQELMREANTIGSKIQDALAIGDVVLLKSEVERFREQVQNVE
jgi:uncharacterized protein (TIGR00255 family)